MSRANEAIFPMMACSQNVATGEVTQYQYLPSLTIREHFAAMAMQGLLARGFQTETEVVKTERGEVLSKITRNLRQQAVHEADALIAELAKEKPNGC